MKQICRGTLPSKPAWASEVLAWMGEVQAVGLSPATAGGDPIFGWQFMAPHNICHCP